MGQSWSGLRKELEQELICDKLKGRRISVGDGHFEFMLISDIIYKKI